MERSERVRALERAAFKIGNTYVMVQLLRAGLWRLIGSPFTGYFLLLRTTGRKSGLPRDTPLNYAIDGGAMVCLAGLGEQANWLQNIRSNPRVHVRLPDRQGDGVATLVADRAEARRLAVAVARNCGFALIFEHPRCLLMSDAQLAARLDGRPVVRIALKDGPVIAGPYDPGGRGWVLPMLGQVVVLGFTLYNSSPALERFFIMRLMIDQRYQGRGYGITAVRLLLQLFHAHPQAAEAAISYNAGNAAARQVYLRCGFEELRTENEGEVLMWRTLNPQPEPWSSLEHIAALSCGSLRLYLFTHSPPTPDKPTITLANLNGPDTTPVIIDLLVSDCRAAYERLRARGVAFLTPPHSPPWGGLRCFAKDPDGYLIELEENEDSPFLSFAAGPSV